MTVETEIAHAFCAIIARHTSIVPTTALVSANAGDLTATIVPLTDALSGRSRFVPSARMGFHDNKGEGLRTIDSISEDGSEVVFRVSPETGFTGLTATHTPGQTLASETRFVYTNLLPYRPGAATERMLDMGDPVVWVKVLEGVTCRNGATMPQTYFDYYSVTVQVERLLNPPTEDCDAEAWNQRVQEDTASDLDAIKTALLSRQTLSTDFAPALGVTFGQLSKSGDLMTTRAGLGPEPSEGGWHWVGSAQAILTTNARLYG